MHGIIREKSKLFLFFFYSPFYIHIIKCLTDLDKLPFLLKVSVNRRSMVNLKIIWHYDFMEKKRDFK